MTCQHLKCYNSRVKVEKVINAKRISIFGVGGAGKSTLAKKLGGLLGLPVYHLDCLYWLPNWVEADLETFVGQVSDITKQNEWIIEGLYKSTFETRFKYADLIIILNFPPEICIESIKTCMNNKEKRIGIPDYLDEADAEIDFENWPPFYEKYPTIVSFVEKHRKKVLEFTSREELESWLKVIDIGTMTGQLLI